MKFTRFIAIDNIEILIINSWRFLQQVSQSISSKYHFIKPVVIRSEYLLYISHLCIYTFNNYVLLICIAENAETLY